MVILETRKVSLPTGSVLGTFGKGVPNSIAINFSWSGGPNCDEGCAQLRSGDCYAIDLEKRGDRKAVSDKLHRHALTPPAILVGKALLELQTLVAKGYKIPWVRISTGGSLPKPENASPLFVSQLRAFLKYAIAQGALVHLPVESPEKAQFYRSIVGDFVTVRESLQSTEAITSTPGAVSCVVGTNIRTGSNIRARRVDAAKHAARMRRQSTGRNTIVCPAITAGWQKRAGKRQSKILCGQCTACANPSIDVIYPFH